MLSPCQCLFHAGTSFLRQSKDMSQALSERNVQKCFADNCIQNLVCFTAIYPVKHGDAKANTSHNTAKISPVFHPASSIHPSIHGPLLWLSHGSVRRERSGWTPKGGVCIMQPEGRGQRWVCVSQLIRVPTERLHHQHPTLTAVEDKRP